MTWEKWFKEHGTYGVNPAITVDQLYEMFRARLLDEVRVDTPELLNAAELVLREGSSNG